MADKISFQDAAKFAKERPCIRCMYFKSHHLAGTGKFAPAMSTCIHPKVSGQTVPDVVTGEMTQTSAPMAYRMRSANGRCGLEGRLWEERQHD